VVQQQHLDTNANAKSVKKTMRQCSECGGETEERIFVQQNGKWCFANLIGAHP
jgi:hypothetical protein